MHAHRKSETITYLKFPTPICLFTIQLLWAMMTIKGNLLLSIPISDILSKILSHQNGSKNSSFGEGFNIKLCFSDPKKTHPCTEVHLLTY